MKKEELDKEIKNTYKEAGLDPIILDGIIDNDSYSKSNHKILWILWEPYNDENDNDNRWDKYNWDSRKWINNDTEGFFKFKTWKNIAYTSYGILNEIKTEEIKNKDNVSDILKHIAYINISKAPREHTSQNPWKYLDEVYAKCHKVLHQQIEHINPDIIICGHCVNYFMDYFGLEHGKSLAIDREPYFEIDKRIIIEAKHPGNRGSQVEYCDDIIETALNLIKNK